MDTISKEWDLMNEDLVNKLKQLIKDKSEQSEIYRVMIQMLISPKTHLKTLSKEKEGK